MAIGANFFSGIAGAAQDLFAGQASSKGLHIKAMGTNLEAEGTRLNATGQRLQAKGNLTEASNYDEAQRLALMNTEYTKQNEGVQEAMLDRQLLLNMGGVKSSTAGAGLTDAGSSDLLADSARQGAIAKQLMGEQALITEAGFDEQAKSYGNLASYARYGASVQSDMADKLDLIATGQNNIAKQEDDLAAQVEENARITSSIKMAGAVFSLGADLIGAFATGGASAAGGAGADEIGATAAGALTAGK